MVLASVRKTRDALLKDVLSSGQVDTVHGCAVGASQVAEVIPVSTSDDLGMRPRDPRPSNGHIIVIRTAKGHSVLRDGHRLPIIGPTIYRQQR